MKIKSIVIILMLIASIGIVSASTTTIIKTQYPAFIAQFGIGEVLYKTISDNGEVSYQLNRNGFKPLTIFADTKYYQINQGSSVVVPITINGCCYAMDWQDYHEHTIYVFDDVTGKLVLQNYPVNVGSTETNKGTSVTLTPPNAVGLYKYKIREMIGLNTVSDGYVLATGNLIVISIQVGTPVPTYTTPVPTYTVPTPTPTVTQPPITPPTIIPPALSRLWNIIMSWITSWLPLSITGGVSVDTTVNQPYSTQISLSFVTPDRVYTDGTYEAKFGKYLILDSAKTIVKEESWSSELTTSPYTVSASFTPTTVGKYYLIGLVARQKYTYASGVWSVVEDIETKEVQELNVKQIGQPVVGQPSTNLLSGLFSWLKGLFPWLPW